MCIIRLIKKYKKNSFFSKSVAYHIIKVFLHRNTIYGHPDNDATETQHIYFTMHDLCMTASLKLSLTDTKKREKMFEDATPYLGIK